jgi:hypothetical protein
VCPMPTYQVTVIGPTGPVATEWIESSDFGGAGQLGLELADQLLDFGRGVAKCVNWRVQIADAVGDVLTELPIRR